MPGIEEKDFFKSLERLEALSKGSEDVNKSQICTGSGGEPQSWPGGDKSKVSEPNNIKNGTDYNGAKVRKSIAEKIMKGEALSEAEVYILKGDYDRSHGGESVNKGGFPPVDEKDEKDDDKDDDKDEGNDKKDVPEGMAAMFGGENKDKAKKSFEGAVRESETLQKGIEVSDFLMELTKAIGIGLAGVEQRVTENVTKSVLGAIVQTSSEQTEFNKSMADAVVNIGHGLAGFMKEAEQAGEQPAGAPRSQLRAVPGSQQQQAPQGVQVMNKGQGGAEDQQQNPLANMEKSQILDRMSDLVEKGQMNPLDVIKFETTNDLSPQAQEIVVKSLNAAGQ